MFFQFKNHFFDVPMNEHQIEYQIGFEYLLQGLFLKPLLFLHHLRGLAAGILNLFLRGDSISQSLGSFGRRGTHQVFLILNIVAQKQYVLQLLLHFRLRRRREPGVLPLFGIGPGEEVTNLLFEGPRRGLVEEQGNLDEVSLLGELRLEVQLFHIGAFFDQQLDLLRVSDPSAEDEPVIFEESSIDGGVLFQRFVLEQD